MSSCRATNAKAEQRKVFARHLKAKRERLGLTQGQLAQLLGVHWVTVSKWERALMDVPKFQLALFVEFTNYLKPDGLGRIAHLIENDEVVEALRLMLGPSREIGNLIGALAKLVGRAP